MWLLFSHQDIVDIHDSVLNPGELTGFAGNKSLDGALGRVESRIQYGSVTDEFDLASAYALSIAQGHVFNDGNKRTAFAVMDMCLYNHDFVMKWDVIEVGDIIIQVAQGKIDEVALATYLRKAKLAQ